ncbi:ATP-binding protein [Streptomyces sp. PTD9-10]|uniref:ATP-binding protein n=1 Tax=Streptomyces sp. PTD9-10 TaxID=3120151 RepID=UPI00300B0E4B
MLIERETETERVREALRAVSGGRSSLLLTAGPLGIGRSAWLRELPTCFPEQDVYVLRAHAAPMEQDFAFGVVRQLFDSLAPGRPEQARERLLHRTPAARQALGYDTAPPAEADVSAAPDAVLHDLRALAEQLGAERPLLILVDDLQWADDWSLRWLAYLARRLHGLRAVIVCALREGEPRSRDPLVREVVEAATGTLRLAPLSRAATARIVREQFGVPGDEEFVRACHETSGGNPVFLMSVVLAMVAGGHRPTADQADTARSLRPSNLRERLTGCLRTQPQPVRDLVAGIATMGEQGTPELVTRLAGLDTVGYATAVRALRQLGLLAEADEPRFVHPVVQDAAEACLILAERQHWHEAAAALLYDGGHPAEQVAAQLMAVAASGAGWSAAVLRAAADSALHRGAPDTAARYLRRALLDSEEQGEERAGLLIHLATAERHFDAAASERHIAQAMSLLDTARDRAAAALRVSPGFLGRTSAGALDILRRAADDLGPHSELSGTPRDLALRLGARLSHSGREDPSELAVAVRLLRDEPQAPPVCSAAEREWLAVLLHAVSLSGSLPASQVTRQATRILEREPARTSEGHSALPLVLSALVAADAADEIDSWLGTEETPALRGVGTADPLVATGHALSCLGRGRLAHAREQAERVFGPAGTGRQEVEAVAGAVLAAVALEMRDHALSERVRARTLASRPLGLGTTTMLRLLEASAEDQRGETARALDTVLDCGRRLEASGWRNPVLFPWRPRAIGLLGRLGDTRSARALAEEEYKQALLWGAPVALGRAQRLRGALRCDSEGTALLRDAVETLRGSGHELELARALRALSMSLGEGAEAKALLGEASGLAAGCGVPWRTDLIAAAAPARAAATRPDVALTPTESRVAALASGGLTNQEIAVELGVGSRVVEKHLTNSYRKLGISGRRELVTLMKGVGVNPRQ